MRNSKEKALRVDAHLFHKLLIKSKWRFKELIFDAKTKKVFDLTSLAFVVLVSFMLTVGFYFYFNRINYYVISLDRNILTTFFTAIGAIIGGVLAITFSFSLFSLQQAADKNTPTILESFAKDRINTWMFIAIGSSSISIFSFSLVPVRLNLTVWLILITGFLLGLTFLLINVQYRHITKIINPTYQLNRLYKNALRYLDKVEDYVNDMVEIGAIRSGWAEEEPLSIKASRNKLKAGLYLRLPSFLDYLDAQLRQIFDIIQKFAQRREYEVTSLGLNYIAGILSQYLIIRKDSTVHFSRTLMNTSTDSDNFLVNNYERLNSIEVIAVRNGDLELAKSVIPAIEHIALASTAVKPLSGVRLDENPITSLTISYLSAITHEALGASLFDVGISAAIALKKIGQALLKHDVHTTIHITFSMLKKIAYSGVMNKRSFLVDYPLAGYAEICHSAIDFKYSGVEILLERALKDVKEIIAITLPIIEDGSLKGIMDTGYYLGSFIDVSKSTAIANIVPRVVELADEENLGEEEIQAIQLMFFHLNEEIALFYRDLSAIIGKTESYLIIYVHASIEMIGDLIFELLSQPRWKEKKRELDDLLSRYLSFYWTLFDAYETITNIHYLQIIDKLSYFGMRATKEGYKKIAHQCISSLFSIAKNFIKKEKNGFGYNPPRIAMNAIYIGILAKKLGLKEIELKVIEGLGEFHHRYMSYMLQQQYPTEDVKNKFICDFEIRLLIEMKELRESYSKDQFHITETAKEYLFYNVEEEDVISFEKNVSVIIDLEKQTYTDE